MKTAIVYASTHHGNTKKLLDAIAAAYEVDLIDAVKIPEKDLNRYDRIGFASGIYYSKFHQAVLNFAAVNMPQNKQTFFISTYGGKADYTSIEKALTAKNSVLLGKYGCKGYDTFGPFKLMGGLAKGHPVEADIAGAVAFYKEITEEKIYKRKNFTEENKTQKRKIFKPTKEKAKADFYKRQKATQNFLHKRQSESRFLQKRN